MSVKAASNLGTRRSAEGQGAAARALHFASPQQSLGGLSSETAATLVASAADVALVIDARGVIVDLAFGNEELSDEGYLQWLGQPWVDTVTVESRRKIETLLAEAGGEAPSRWRQVNHPSAHGADVPVLYSVLRVDGDGRVVAVGRDLRAMAVLQQRLVDAQQSMERDYSRLRHAETRYRLLFQIASEAVLVVDASTQRITEANPAAAQLLGENSRRLVGRSFPYGFDAEGTQAVQVLLAGVRAAGRGEDVRIRMVDSEREFMVSASLFRQDNSAHFLVRLTPLHVDPASAVVPRAKSQLLEVMESSPDALVVTTLDGRILTSNRAFLELVQVPTAEQVRDESLDRWLGRRGVDLNVLMANLRQHGSVRTFATSLRGEYGSSVEVELAAVSVSSAEQPCLGFSIRAVGRRAATEPRSGRELPRSVEQLTGLVGRVSLKELVRETTDVIERLCIEAALELTGDNRASAAEMLGLSRQSLYVKLRRYGLGDLASEPDKQQ